jgi:hypothetical protein
MRVLFAAKRIVAVEDNGREEGLLKQLEEEKKSKRLALEREASLAQQLQLARAEIIRLKEEVAQYKLERIMETAMHKNSRYFYHKQLTLSNKDDCRCLCIDEHHRVCVISRGDQLVRVSLDLTSNGYSVLNDASHSRTIKCIAGGFFKDGLIATVGLDCRVKLTSLQSGAIVTEWGLPSAGWSVSFDRLDRNIVFVGLANRRISIFDIRKTGIASKEAVLVDSGSPPLPVHSLFTACVGTKRAPGSALPLMPGISSQCFGSQTRPYRPC